MTRQQVLDYARAQLGKPYVWDASGPDSFDCSGLTMRAYAAAGVELAHYTVTQYDALRHVAIGAALPGDLLFFGGYDPANGLPHHVGIYVAPGAMIDAPTEGVPIGLHDYTRYGDVMDVVGVYPGEVAVPAVSVKKPTIEKDDDMKQFTLLRQNGKPNVFYFADGLSIRKIEDSEGVKAAEIVADIQTWLKARGGDSVVHYTSRPLATYGHPINF